MSMGTKAINGRKPRTAVLPREVSRGRRCVVLYFLWIKNIRKKAIKTASAKRVKPACCLERGIEPAINIKGRLKTRKEHKKRAEKLPTKIAMNVL